MALPLENPKIYEQLREVIAKNDITILEAGTGSGKSTIGPILIHRMYPERKIAVTEPRILNVTGISKRIADRLGVTIGSIVGYKYRFHREVTSRTLITFMTDALLIEDFLSGEERYDIIMVDEVHERNVNIDLILTLMKMTFMKNRSDIKQSWVKYILLSATIDKKEIISYFQDVATVGSLFVPGRAFPIEHVYHSIKGHPVDVVAKITQDILASPGDILVFMPTKSMITGVINKLAVSKDTIVIPLYRGVKKHVEELAISPDQYKKQGYKKKIVVATPIAEAGITIEGVKHIIDSDRANIHRFDQVTEVMYYDTRLITKFNVIQRCGRAGRVAPGTCHHAYSEEEYQKMIISKRPDISNSDLRTPILALISGTNSVRIARQILEMTPAKLSERALDHYFMSLYKYGLIIENELTVIGKLISSLALDVTLALLLIHGFKYHVINYIIPIVTMMSVSWSPDSFLESGYKNPYGDPITLLDMYRDWKTKKVHFLSEIEEQLELNDSDIAKKLSAVLEKKIIVPSLPEPGPVIPGILRCFEEVFDKRAIYYPHLQSFIADDLTDHQFTIRNPFFEYPDEIFQIGYTNAVVINSFTYTFRFIFRTDLMSDSKVAKE